MNQYPTVFVSLRKVDGLIFGSAYRMLALVFTELFNKHLYVLENENGTDFERTAFEHIASGHNCDHY